MFGRKKKQQPLAAVVVAPKPTRPSMSAEDRELLEEIAGELIDCILSFDGDPLLDGAEAASIATIPVPSVEIEYPDYCVSLTMSVYRYTEEDLA